jgi:hypothetical protein
MPLDRIVAKPAEDADAAEGGPAGRCRRSWICHWKRARRRWPLLTLCSPDVLGAAGAAPTRVATHLLAGGPRGNHATVEALRTAARDAMAQGAPEAAATYRARALAEPPADADRTGVTLELGPALACARPTESRPHLWRSSGPPTTTASSPLQRSR